MSMDSELGGLILTLIFVELAIYVPYWFFKGCPLPFGWRDVREGGDSWNDGNGGGE